MKKFLILLAFILPSVVFAAPVLNNWLIWNGTNWANTSTTALGLLNSYSSTTANARFNSLGLGKAHDTNTVLDLKTLNATVNKGLRIENDNASNLPFGTYITGDANLRYTFGPDGSMNWGDGTNNTDTNLYRSAANVLKTDDAFISLGTTTATCFTTNGTTCITGGSSTINNYGVTATSTIFNGGWTTDVQGYVLAADLGYNLSSEFATTTTFTNSFKPLWIGIGSAGVYQRYNQDGSNPYGYSSANQTLFEQNSGLGVMPFVSDSYTGSGNAQTMIEATTTRTTWINSAVADTVALNWRGLTVDIEGFGAWSATQNYHFLVFVEQLCDTLHASNKVCQVYAPPIWNTAANTESGTGDAWDSANSQGYYDTTYTQLDAIDSIDFVEIPLYDYEFDYGSEAPEAPLRWITDVATFAKSKFTDDRKIVIGVSAQGHYGADGYGDFNSWTYAGASAQAQFSTATRNAASGELFWKPSTVNYWIADNTTQELRRSVIEKAGISHMSIWYVGDGKYGSNKDTVLEVAQIGIGTSTPATALDVFGTTTTKALNVVNPATATSSVYIYSKSAGKGGTMILEDVDGAGCTGITAINGILTAVTVTCPTEI